MISHRWSTDDNQNGQTLCVSTKDHNKPETFNGWLFTPVQIKGESNSENILAACRASKLQAPCDHPSYNDGNCVTVFTGGHLSHPDNNGKFPLFFNKNFYAVGNNGLSLHNTGTTHRWSNGNDKDGVTLCVSWNDASQKPVDYNGWTFKPVGIKGTSNSANILAACQAAGLQTPCDNPAYSDGKCVTVETWGHLSHNPTSGYFDGLRALASNKFFYLSLIHI